MLVACCVTLSCRQARGADVRLSQLPRTNKVAGAADLLLLQAQGGGANTNTWTITLNNLLSNAIFHGQISATNFTGSNVTLYGTVALTNLTPLTMNGTNNPLSVSNGVQLITRQRGNLDWITRYVFYDDFTKRTNQTIWTNTPVYSLSGNQYGVGVTTSLTNTNRIRILDGELINRSNGIPNNSNPSLHLMFRATNAATMWGRGPQSFGMLWRTLPGYNHGNSNNFFNVDLFLHISNTNFVGLTDADRGASLFDDPGFNGLHNQIKGNSSGYTLYVQGITNGNFNGRTTLLQILWPTREANGLAAVTNGTVQHTRFTRVGYNEMLVESEGWSTNIISPFVGWCWGEWGDAEILHDNDADVAFEDQRILALYAGNADGFPSLRYSENFTAEAWTNNYVPLRAIGKTNHATNIFEVVDSSLTNIIMRVDTNTLFARRILATTNLALESYQGTFGRIGHSAKSSDVNAWSMIMSPLNELYLNGADAIRFYAANSPNSVLNADGLKVKVTAAEGPDAGTAFTVGGNATIRQTNYANVLVSTNFIFLRTNTVGFPSAAPYNGAACFVNSNGTVFLLTALPASTAWGATNKLGP